MELPRRNILSALLVLFSAFIFPFARGHWGSMTLEFFDYQLYFVWGMYSFRFNSVQFYDEPFATPYDTQSIVAFWIASSIILALSILSLARCKHQSTKGRVTIVVLFALQIIVLAFQNILPLLIFGPDPAPPFTYTISVTPFPVPSVLSIIVFSTLLLVQIRSEFSKLYHRESPEAVSSDSVV
jgi:hypothetical protein